MLKIQEIFVVQKPLKIERKGERGRGLNIFQNWELEKVIRLKSWQFGIWIKFSIRLYQTWLSLNNKKPEKRRFRRFKILKIWKFLTYSPEFNILMWGNNYERANNPSWNFNQDLLPLKKDMEPFMISTKIVGTPTSICADEVQIPMSLVPLIRGSKSWWNVYDNYFLIHNQLLPIHYKINSDNRLKILKYPFEILNSSFAFFLSEWVIHGIILLRLQNLTSF